MTSIRSFSAKPAAGLFAALLFLGSAGFANAQAPAPFARDLTVGSSGTDVTALQAFLITQGFTVSAGATGYFGSQTKAALGAYQAAHGIAPASGYFGPVTRASVNAAQAPSTPTVPSTPATPSTGLSGGEADLRSFKLKGEQSTGNEGDQGVEVATASFDVRNGDIRIERVDLVASSTNPSLSTQPWKYFDRVSVLANGKTVLSEDVDSKSDWSETSKGVYRLSLTGLSSVVRKGDEAELTFAFDIKNSIDSANQDQSFAFSIEDRGIRAVDAKGIQQYAGKSGSSVSFGFASEENGDLSLQSNQKDPDASILVADDKRESKAYNTFVFDLKNGDKADALVTDLTVRVTDLGTGVSATDVLRRATLAVGGTTYRGDIQGTTIVFKDMKARVKGDAKQSFSLSTTLKGNATSTPIRFAVAAADIEAEGASSGDSSKISGSRQSALHTVARSGVTVGTASANAAVTLNSATPSASYGTFTLKFTVAGIEEDVFVAPSTSSSGTAGVLYAIDGDSFSGEENAVITSNAKLENGFYRVPEGESKTFTLTVTLNPDAGGFYAVRLGSVRFNTEADLADSTEFSIEGNKNGFHTDPVYIPN